MSDSKLAEIQLTFNSAVAPVKMHYNKLDLH